MTRTTRTYAIHGLPPRLTVHAERGKFCLVIHGPHDTGRRIDNIPHEAVHEAAYDAFHALPVAARRSAFDASYDGPTGYPTFGPDDWDRCSAWIDAAIISDMHEAR